MILMIDNYDSFTYNLVQEICEISGEVVEVVRNDAASVGELLDEGPAAVVISPGPGEPTQAGVTLELIEAAHDVPLLGICLGLQALAMVHGGRIVRAPEPVHGKTSMMHHDGAGIFRGLPEPFEATRYHSLVVDRDTVGTELDITSWTSDGVIMGLAHRSRPHFGVQFHPESYLSRHGMQLLANFLETAAVTVRPDWDNGRSGGRP